MIFHSFSIPRLPIAILLSVLCVSCEDPALVKKHGEQQAEIAKLRGELALVQERLKNIPQDRSGDLEKATMEAKKLVEEQSRLADDVAKLQAEEKALQEKYEAYRRKYAVN